MGSHRVGHDWSDLAAVAAAATHANHPTPHSGEKKHLRNTYEAHRLEAQTHLETETQPQYQRTLPSPIPHHHINKGLLTAIHSPFTWYIMPSTQKKKKKKKRQGIPKGKNRHLKRQKKQKNQAESRCWNYQARDFKQLWLLCWGLSWIKQTAYKNIWAMQAERWKS